jgi:hypothetical protein
MCPIKLFNVCVYYFSDSPKNNVNANKNEIQQTVINNSNNLPSPVVHNNNNNATPVPIEVDVRRKVNT